MNVGRSSCRLHNGVTMPGIGFGTWKLPVDEAMPGLVSAALECGYRQFDTAGAYGNDYAVVQALLSSGVPRDELFIASKLWNTYRGDKVRKGVRQTLKRCSLDYVDLLMMHWPASPALHPNWREINAETWRGMEELLDEGVVRAIGVSNFPLNHLEALSDTARIVPMVDQVEFHPGMPNCSDFLYACSARGIVVQAWSPLGSGRLLDNPVLLDIAHQKNVSVAQVCVKWCLQQGVVPVVKSSSPDRLRENIDVMSFDLSPQDMARIGEMPVCGCSGLDPNTIVEFG